MTESIATIIPYVCGDGVQKTQGTKVVLADGVELTQVTGIVLTCKMNDLWRAQIDCMVRMTPVTASAVIVFPKRKLTLRERLFGYIEQEPAEPGDGQIGGGD